MERGEGVGGGDKRSCSRGAANGHSVTDEVKVAAGGERTRGINALMIKSVFYGGAGSQSRV